MCATCTKPSAAVSLKNLKMSEPVNIALLLAGGLGHRLGGDCPKQFAEVAGLPVIARTMRTFGEHPRISAIYVVCSPAWAGYVEEVARRAGVGKFRKTFAAGETSFGSLSNGVAGLCAEFGTGNPAVVTHEAVRPLVSAGIISANLDVFEAHGNAVTAVRSHETYMVSPDGESAVEHIPRELLHRSQTPVTFRLDDLKEAFSIARSRGICQSQSLYTLMTEVFPGRRFFIAPGSELNFKLTLPGDLEILQALLAAGLDRRHGL